MSNAYFMLPGPLRHNHRRLSPAKGRARLRRRGGIDHWNTLAFIICEVYCQYSSFEDALDVVQHRNSHCFELEGSTSLPREEGKLEKKVRLDAQKIWQTRRTHPQFLNQSEPETVSRNGDT